MTDTGSEWEGVAEPWDVIEVAIFFFLFFLLFFIVVFVLTNVSNHIHTGYLGTNSHSTNT